MTQSYALTSSLTCAAGTTVGLRIASNVTLYVAPGVALTGPGSGTGILFNGVSDAEVIGQPEVDNRFRVTGWKVGVQLTNGAHHNTVQYVRVHNNVTGAGTTGDFGVDLRSTGALTHDNTLDQLTVEANGDEGVHMGGGSGITTLTGSLIFGNQQQQVYLANTNGNRIQGNWIGGVATIAAVRVSNSNNNTIEGNLIGNGDVLFTAGSTGNRMIGDNRLIESRVMFKPGIANSTKGACGCCASGSVCPTSYQTCSNDDACPVGTPNCVMFGPITTPHDNNVVGVDISGATKGCVVYETSSCDAANQQPYRNNVSGATLRCTGSTGSAPGNFDVRSEESLSGDPGTFVATNFVCASQCLANPSDSTGATRACLRSTPPMATDDEQDPMSLITLTSTPCPPPP